MIYTITFNPALDYYLTFENELMEEEVNRVKTAFYKIGGKGLNVSSDLSLFGIPSSAIALIGGFTGSYIERSYDNHDLIRLIPIPVKGNTRINVKAHAVNRNIMMNDVGPEADEAAIDLVHEILNNLNPEDWVLICGSLMRGITKQHIWSLAEHVHERGAKLVVDCEQIDLDDLKIIRPYLVKPNLHEIRILTGRTDLSTENIQSYLEKENDIFAENILLSLGKHGALLKYGKCLYRMDQPDNVAINKVGAGDAMLAAFIGELSIGKPVEEALRWAGAAGNAVASTLEDIDFQTIQHFYELISVDEIKEGEDVQNNISQNG